MQANKNVNKKPKKSNLNFYKILTNKMLLKTNILMRCTLQSHLGLCKYATETKRAVKRGTAAAADTSSTKQISEFPEKLLTKKHKIPAHMYVANNDIAKQIQKYMEPFVAETNCDTIVELNPGPGYFTRTLLDREDKYRKIILIESMEHFLPQLHELHSLYPERVKVRHGDFVSMWKLAYQDKMDNGTRVAELLHDVPQREFTQDPNVLLFGAIGSYNFFKHLINSLVFQQSLYLHGRFEMFLAIPPPIYIHLTCSNEIGYMIYRSTSILFQILFEHRFIAKVPREAFLPIQTEHNIAKNSKLRKVKSINPEYLYLARIVPRRNIFELCPAADMPALWYFVKQNFVSRRNRIIPNLEKWIPGCGPRLIINQQQSKPTKPLYANEIIKKLPKFSNPCTTMSTADYFPGINIYTQFGDLSPSQVLTLFTQFKHWPEYNESSFLASFENMLLKMETSADESIDGVNLHEEDDISIETNENVNEDVEKSKASKRTNRKSDTISDNVN